MKGSKRKNKKEK